MKTTVVPDPTHVLGVALAQANHKYKRKFDMNRSISRKKEDRKDPERVSHVSMSLYIADGKMTLFAITRKIPVVKWDNASKKWVKQEFEQLAAEALISLSSKGLQNIIIEKDDPTENQAKATWKKGSDV